MDAVSIADVDLKTVEFFAHGTTVVINALMERKGVKTGLITNKGLSRHIGNWPWEPT